jgi:hypothetical protein
MRGSNGEEVHEFLGMWPLKPDADLVGLRDTLSREGAPFWAGPGKTFSEATTQLGLIRTARWFVGTSTEFGPTLYFVSQFDSSLEKYFDDFVLNRKTNLEKSVQAVTLGGVFYGVKQGARQMIEQGRPGVIINISSVNFAFLG